MFTCTCTLLWIKKISFTWFLTYTNYNNLFALALWYEIHFKWRATPHCLQPWKEPWILTPGPTAALHSTQILRLEYLFIFRVCRGDDMISFTCGASRCTVVSHEAHTKMFQVIFETWPLLFCNVWVWVLGHNVGIVSRCHHQMKE